MKDQFGKIMLQWELVRVYWRELKLKNSIVGASALVTKDVPPGKVVMGVPAKVIRDV